MIICPNCHNDHSSPKDVNEHELKRLCELNRQLKSEHSLCSEAIEGFKDELASEREKVERLREGLKRLQWRQTDTGEWSYCPVCRDIRSHINKHKSDCWLSNLLEQTK